MTSESGNESGEVVVEAKDEVQQRKCHRCFRQVEDPKFKTCIRCRSYCSNRYKAKKEGTWKSKEPITGKVDVPTSAQISLADLLVKMFPVGSIDASTSFTLSHLGYRLEVSVDMKKELVGSKEKRDEHVE